MSKEDCIEMTGTVVEKFPSGLFSVQLDQERTVLAHLAGKLRRNRIRVLAGDRSRSRGRPTTSPKGASLTDTSSREPRGGSLTLEPQSECAPARAERRKRRGRGGR